MTLRTVVGLLLFALSAAGIHEQALGWRLRAVQRLFVFEGLILALMGTIPGSLASLLILTRQHAAQQIPSVLIAGGTILLLVSVASLATLPALRAIHRMRVLNVIRSD